jgi:hypothetical protein
MLKSSGFPTLKNSKMSCKCDRNVIFFLLKSDTQGNHWIFSDSAQALTITSNNFNIIHVPIQRIIGMCLVFYAQKLERPSKN